MNFDFDVDINEAFTGEGDTFQITEKGCRELMPFFNELGVEPKVLKPGKETRQLFDEKLADLLHDWTIYHYFDPGWEGTYQDDGTPISKAAYDAALKNWNDPYNRGVLKAWHAQNRKLY